MESKKVDIMGIEEFIERDELGEIEEELDKIYKEAKDFVITKHSKWLYCLIYQRYIALQKKRQNLLRKIAKIPFELMGKLEESQ